MPHLVQVVHLLYSLVKRGANWDWTLTLEQVFQQVKHIIKCAQALHILGPAKLCELNVHVTQEGFGWDLWQQSEQLCQPSGFWSQLWRGAEMWHSLIEKNWLQYMLPVGHRCYNRNCPRNS